MELRQLRAFATVARLGSFTRAADELYVTQSALSQQVGKLERELGVALLRRGAKGSALTPAGEELLGHAQRILAEADAAHAQLAVHADEQRGLLRVAAGPMDLPWLAPAIVAFQEAHPALRVALRAQPADVVVGGEEIKGLGRATRLRRDELVVVAAPGHALTRRRAVALWELRDEPFALPSESQPARGAFAAAGFSPVPLFEVADATAARLLVHSGLAIGVVPASWLDGPGPEVAPVRTKESLGGRDVFAVTPTAPSRGARLLIAHCRQ
jgi:LysR family transcriptional regulator, carnitine catabolism transcriptional activator